MPVQSEPLKSGDRVLVFTCETCGALACFGYDANVAMALKIGNVSLAGRWYCVEHNRTRKQEAA
jgi:hypothetical protein